MQKFALQACASAFGLLAWIALATIPALDVAQAADQAPGAMQLAQSSPGVEPAPIAPIPGQLNLNDEQRQQIRKSVEQANPPAQPVPRAFAPAVGMTSPPELKLEPLPEPARGVPGIHESHSFAMLENGMLMVVGHNRLVVALIGPTSGGSTGTGGPTSGR